MDATTRFLKYAHPEPNTGCWLWSGGYSGNGRPVFSFKSISRHASIFAYENFKEKIVKGNDVRHLCHNPACVNPDHLLQGSRKDNMKDCIKANRLTTRKLTVDQVKSILNEYIPNVVSLTILSKKYDVSRRTILDIIKKRKYEDAFNPDY